MTSMTHLDDRQIREQLVAEYSRQEYLNGEAESVRSLKGELYRRGYQRWDIIRLALASRIRRARRAS